MDTDGVCVSSLWDGVTFDCTAADDQLCGSVGGYRFYYRDASGVEHEYVHPSAQAQFDIFPDPMPSTDWPMEVGILDASGREFSRQEVTWNP